MTLAILLLSLVILLSSIRLSSSCAETVHDTRVLLEEGFGGTIFTGSLALKAHEIREANEEKGWKAGMVEDGTRIALIHSELSEALEALRHGNPPSKHIPKFSALEEEMADVVIRVLDFCAIKELKVGEAIEAKLAFNKTRPHKYGGKLF